jgi:hypothetical protein
MPNSGAKRLIVVCDCIYIKYMQNNYNNACNEANVMHYLSTVYSVTIPLHVSGLLAAHNEEVTM